MDYLLKSSALLFLMYLGYALFLKKETFFTHNRLFLLVGIITASLLPLIEIPVYIPVEVTTQAEVPLQFQYIPTEIIVQEQPFDWLQLTTNIYLAGVAVFFIQFLFQFGSLAILLFKSSKNKDGIYTYVIVKSKISPFSFFKWIVYNPKLFSEKELQLILNHEKVHVRQWHSVDMILSRLVCIAFWFNPICWMYHKSIQQNLEYIADTETQNTSASEKDYQALLLKTTVANTNINLTSNFYNSLIKKRIVMLQKSKSNPINRWKSALVIPFFILFLMSVNTKEVFVEVEKPITEKSLSIIKNPEDEKRIEAYFTKNTTDAQLKSISKHLKEKGISLKIKTLKRNKKGLITNIKLTFSTDKAEVSYAEKDSDGIDAFVFLMKDDAMEVKAAEINEEIEIVEEIETPLIIEETPEMENETETEIVIEQQPKQTVRASYTFVSSDTLVINKPVIKANGNVKVRTNTFTIKRDNIRLNSFNKNNDPIFILNGKKINRKSFKSIEPNDIEKVDVIKGDKAIKLYGKSGKDGVIKITTKKNSKPKKRKKYNNQKNPWGFEVSKVEYIPSTTKEDAKVFIKSADKPLIIINNEKLGNIDASDIDFNIVKDITIVKGKKATEMYGEKAKNGAVIIFTKDKYERSQKERKKYTSEISAVGYSDETKPKDAMVLYFISKITPDSMIDKHINQLKSEGIIAKVSKLKRNKSGEITKIKIKLSDENGNNSEAVFSNNEGISTIKIGKQGSTLVVSSEKF